MKNFFIPISLLCFCLLSGCGSPGVSHENITGSHRIVLENCLNQSGPVKLSEIADELQYVELRSPHSVPIRAFRVQASRDYLFATTRDGLMQFDLQGNFIRNIGSRGNGPGEYQDAFTFFIDEDSQTIEVFCMPKTCLFSFEGRLLRETSIPIFLINLWIQDSLIYTAESPDGSKKNRLTILSRNMDTLGNIPNYKRFKPWDSGLISFGSLSGSTDGFYAYDRQVYFTGDADNDSIWRLDGLSYTLHALIDMGKYKAPEPHSARDMENDFDRMERKAGDYYQIDNILEDSRYIYLSASPYYNPKMEAPRILFNKRTKTGVSPKTEDGIYKLTDDILGGLPFWPRTMSQHIAVGDWIESEKLLTQYKELPAPGSRLQEFMKGITEDSGTIVILARLKSEQDSGYKSK